MSLLPKSEQDCVFFLQGICSKTDCEYRHCEPCLTNLNVCPDWQNGKPCSRPNCAERHSNKHLANTQGFVKSTPNPETPCKYNLNCQRPDCIFKHTGPRYIDTQQQRSFFPRPMSMTFRPRPQAAGGVESAAQPAAIGQQQPQAVPVQQAAPQAVRPAYNRPDMQRPQARPNQFIPQANNNNQNAPAKGQLQIAGLSSRQNQNANIRPVQQQTQAQNVRPTNKLRPMSERLSLPNGNNNNNARNGVQNGNAKANLQSKAGPAKAEKPPLRQAPITNAKVRGVVQLEKPRTSSGPSFGDPLTIEQIRAMKANKAKAAGQAPTTTTPQASAPATNIQKPAPKVAATKPTPVQNVKATIPPKRTIEDTAKEETQATNDTTNIDDLGYGDYSQFDAELLELEKPVEPVPEPKKAKVEPVPVLDTTGSHTVTASDPKKNKLDDATVPEAKKTKIDSAPAQPQPTTTELDQIEDLDNLGGDYDLGASGIDADFLAELENY